MSTNPAAMGRGGVVPATECKHPPCAPQCTHPPCAPDECHHHPCPPSPTPPPGRSVGS